MSLRQVARESCGAGDGARRPDEQHHFFGGQRPPHDGRQALAHHHVFPVARLAAAHLLGIAGALHAQEFLLRIAPAPPARMSGPLARRFRIDAHDRRHGRRKFRTDRIDILHADPLPHRRPGESRLPDALAEQAGNAEHAVTGHHVTAEGPLGPGDDRLQLRRADGDDGVLHAVEPAGMGDEAEPARRRHIGLGHMARIAITDAPRPEAHANRGRLRVVAGVPQQAGARVRCALGRGFHQRSPPSMARCGTMRDSSSISALPVTVSSPC